MEAAAGRFHAGQRGAEGLFGKEVVTPAGKRKAVVHLRDAFGMSERRACKAIGCCRMTMRYETTRADDVSVRQRLRAIAQERRRFGYRRLHALPKREGTMVNHKKLFRPLSGRKARGAPPWRSQAGHEATFYNWRKKYAGLMPSEM